MTHLTFQENSTHLGIRFLALHVVLRFMRLSQEHRFENVIISGWSSNLIEDETAIKVLTTPLHDLIDPWLRPAIPHKGHVGTKQNTTRWVFFELLAASNDRKTAAQICEISLGIFDEIR